MRWDGLRAEQGGELALFGAEIGVRTVSPPQFRGITFHEVRARSIINSVPAAAGLPFRWTINPYRGCSHSCVYCFARRTHEYLDLDAGHDFDSQIVVKINAGDLLRRELAAARWHGEPIAMGTNTDPYQRAEGRYRLMRPILSALRDAANPFSILTKGTLMLRDLDLITQAAAVTDVSLAVSVGSIDDTLTKSVEPGTPSPRRRLDVVRRVTEAGIGCSVLMAPILPALSDAPDQLEATVAAIAASGATGVTPLILHLRPGAREWYLQWLAREHPRLLARYRQMYGAGTYAPKDYQQTITEQVRQLAKRYGMGRSREVKRFGHRHKPADQPVRPEPQQLRLC